MTTIFPSSSYKWFAKGQYSGANRKAGLNHTHRKKGFVKVLQKDFTKA